MCQSLDRSWGYGDVRPSTCSWVTQRPLWTQVCKQTKSTVKPAANNWCYQVQYEQSGEISKLLKEVAM